MDPLLIPKLLVACNKDDSPVDSGDPDTLGRPEQITVGSWNVAGFVSGAADTRLPLAGQYANGFGTDVIVMQEVGNRDNYERLETPLLGYSYTDWTAENADGEELVGPGLAFFSDVTPSNIDGDRRLPVEFYTDCSNNDYDDCLSDKAFTVAKMPAFGTDSGFVVINTHMDAGDTPEDQAARASQLTQIAAEIENLKANPDVHVILVIGDLNYESGDADYATLQEFMATNDMTDACEDLPNECQASLDALLAQDEDEGVVDEGCAETALYSDIDNLLDHALLWSRGSDVRAAFTGYELSMDYYTDNDGDRCVVTDHPYLRVTIRTSYTR